jgi:hypothetical protein
MTPKEKAQELIDKYDSILTYKSKQCALVAVDEILNTIDWHEFETPNKELDYWIEVKREIQIL